MENLGVDHGVPRTEIGGQPSVLEAEKLRAVSRGLTCLTETHNPSVDSQTSQPQGPLMEKSQVPLRKEPATPPESRSNPGRTDKKPMKGTPSLQVESLGVEWG